VEGRLFRVPRSEFEVQSEVFRDRFLMPSAGNEGDSDDKPIQLLGVKKGAFHDLLVILHPRPRMLVITNLDLLSRPSTPEEKANLPPPPPNWAAMFCWEQDTGNIEVTNGIASWHRSRLISVFELVHMWCFEYIKTVLAGTLQSLWDKDDIVDQICFAHKYEIEEWYPATYATLACRDEPLTEEEGERLGLRFSLRMGRVRERRIQRKWVPPSYSYLKQEDEPALKEDIKATFEFLYD